MRNLLTHIVLLKILSATLAERALPQYSDLLTALTQQNSGKGKSRDCNDTRLATFSLMISHSRCQQNYNLS